ncbi:hypothetical protein CCP4SC76_2140010 [Gammaproteobacteria bacterium]
MNAQGLILGFSIAVICQGVVAGSLNTLPEGNPGAQAKVARNMSKMNAMDPNVGKQDQVGCNQNVGNLDLSKHSGAAPREQITVVRGDAINICK